MEIKSRNVYEHSTYIGPTAAIQNTVHYISSAHEGGQQSTQNVNVRTLKLTTLSESK